MFFLLLQTTIKKLEKKLNKKIEKKKKQKQNIKKKKNISRVLCITKTDIIILWCSCKFQYDIDTSK